MPRKTKENTKKRRKSKSKNIEETKENKFNFDEEIVIGLRRIDEEPKNDKKSTKNKKKKKRELQKDYEKSTSPKGYGYNTNKQLVHNKKQNKRNKNKHKTKKDVPAIQEEARIKNRQVETYDEFNLNVRTNEEHAREVRRKQKQLTKKQELSRKRRKVILKILRWLTLIGIIIGGIIYTMLSPIFGIKNINVNGNTKIASDTIISLSGLSIDQNIFDFWTSDVIESIKTNAYINKVQVERKFPDTINIYVTEREATFNLKIGNAYAYINNQGYILEINSNKQNLPVVIGYKTESNQIQPGNRLNTEDLERLTDVLKIMEAASSANSKITETISEIDITDRTNYILKLEKEKKIVHLGDASNLGTKMLWINKFLEEEKKSEGVIFVNMDLNNENPYFREKV